MRDIPVGMPGIPPDRLSTHPHIKMDYDVDADGKAVSLIVEKGGNAFNLADIRSRVKNVALPAKDASQSGPGCCCPLPRCKAPYSTTANRSKHWNKKHLVAGKSLQPEEFKKILDAVKKVPLHAIPNDWIDIFSPDDIDEITLLTRMKEERTRQGSSALKYTEVHQEILESIHALSAGQETLLQGQQNLMDSQVAIHEKLDVMDRKLDQFKECQQAAYFNIRQRMLDAYGVSSQPLITAKFAKEAFEDEDDVKKRRQGSLGRLEREWQDIFERYSNVPDDNPTFPFCEEDKYYGGDDEETSDDEDVMEIDTEDELASEETDEGESEDIETDDMPETDDEWTDSD